MDEQLKQLRRAMMNTTFKDLSFDETHRKNVHRRLNRRKRFRLNLSWFNPALSAAVCLLLFAGAVYIGMDQNTGWLKKGSPSSPQQEGKPDEHPDVKFNTPADSNPQPDRNPRQAEDHGLPVEGDIQWTGLNMTSQQNGWKFGTSETNGIIARTTDGGRLWHTVKKLSGPNASFESPFFLDHKTVWVGVKKNPQTSKILSTTDGGKHWSESVIHTDGRFKQIFFVNHQVGWVFFSNGMATGSELVELYKTEDGGKSWSKIMDVSPKSPGSGLPLGGGKTGLGFATETTGWISGGDASGNLYLYETHDGGKSWIRRKLPVPFRYDSAWLTTMPAKFFTSETGVIPVRANVDNKRTLLFFVTKDTGKTWTLTGSITHSAKRSLTYDLDRAQRWFAIDGKNLYISKNMGKSWEKTPLDGPLKQRLENKAVIDALDFVNENMGWALVRSYENGDTFIFKTTDGGRTWEPQSTE